VAIGEEQSIVVSGIAFGELAERIARRGPKEGV
jgi:hypothetical protein